MSNTITMFIGHNEENIRTRAAFEYTATHGYREDLVYTTQQQLANSVIHTSEAMIENKVDVVVDGSYSKKEERQAVLRKFRDAGYTIRIVSNLELMDLDFDEADELFINPVERK